MQQAAVFWKRYFSQACCSMGFKSKRRPSTQWPRVFRISDKKNQTTTVLNLPHTHRHSRLLPARLCLGHSLER